MEAGRRQAKNRRAAGVSVGFDSLGGCNVTGVGSTCQSDMSCDSPRNSSLSR
jgi:hypothetical protein